MDIGGKSDSAVKSENRRKTNQLGAPRLIPSMIQSATKARFDAIAGEPKRKIGAAAQSSDV